MASLLSGTHSIRFIGFVELIGFVEFVELIGLLSRFRIRKKTRARQLFGQRALLFDPRQRQHCITAALIHSFT